MAHFKSDLAKSESLSSREAKCYRIKKKISFLESVIYNNRPLYLVCFVFPIEVPGEINFLFFMRRYARK